MRPWRQAGRQAGRQRHGATVAEEQDAAACLCAHVQTELTGGGERKGVNLENARARFELFARRTEIQKLPQRFKAVLPGLAYAVSTFRGLARQHRESSATPCCMPAAWAIMSSSTGRTFRSISSSA